MQNQNFESGFESRSRHWPALSLLGMAGTVATIVATPAIGLSEAAPPTQWNFDPAANKLEITVKEGTTPRYFMMAQPARIVVDLPGTSVGAGDTQKSFSGAVREVRISQHQPGVARIVMTISPDVSLAPGQVQLQKVGKADTAQQTRWVVRPLIQSPGKQPAALKPAPIAAPTPAVPSSQLPTVTTGIDLAPPPVVTPVSAGTANPAIVTLGEALPPAPTPEVSAPPVATITPLPSTGPDPEVAVTGPATEIAVPLPQTLTPPAPPVTIARASEPSAAPRDAIVLPDIPSSIAVAPTPATPQVTVPPLGAPPPAINGPASPAASASQEFTRPAPALGTIATPELPASLPLTLNPPESTVSVRVPDLMAATPVSNQASGSTQPSVVVPPLQPAPIVSPAAAPVSPGLPMQAELTGQPQPSVVVPPLQPVAPDSFTPVSNPDPGSVTVPRGPTVVEFGQPLPAAPVTPLAPSAQDNSGLILPAQSLSPDVLLPSGATLSLRYPGEANLPIRTNSAHQEVLLLESEIRDFQGRLVAPVNSPVLGRFETNSGGSRFVTQAIAIRGQNVPLMATSNTLEGSRQVSDNRLVMNSGIGALAGGVVGGLSGSAGWGVVGGAATGAALTYFTSPKPATIQPGQVIQVRLLQDLRQP